MAYVDGFLLPVPTKNLQAYRRMSRMAGKIWREHGALEYRECASEDLEAPFCLSFKTTLTLKPDETVLFSWIVFKSRAHRDRVNAKVMKDPRMNNMVKKGEEMPFDVQRMVYGGFKILVDV